jgi:hypothetical protein
MPAGFQDRVQGHTHVTDQQLGLADQGGVDLVDVAVPPVGGFLGGVPALQRRPMIVQVSPHPGVLIEVDQ